MKSYFYPQSIYTAVVAFEEIFKEMSVRVYSESGEVVGAKPVVVSLAPKEKIAWILDKGAVNDVDPQVDNYLPRISVAMEGLTWDPNRQAGKYETRKINIEYKVSEGKRELQTDLNSVPYNLNFTVTIWTKYMTDGMQILENILPWFAPAMTVSYKERNFGIEHKAKVALDGVTQNLLYEYGENERRILQWNLSFTMEATFWKPMKITPEILCNIISIASVPCKKSKFEGSKIVMYDPDPGAEKSEFAINPQLETYSLTDVDGYNQMVQYWKQANAIMAQPCLDGNCADEIMPEVVYDVTTPGISSCGGPELKKPKIIVEPVSGMIQNYWQEFINENNVVSIISLLQVYNNEGVEIGPVQLIPNENYPS